MRSLLAFAAITGLSHCRNKQQPLVVSDPITPLQIQPIEQPLIGFGTWNLKESEDNTTEAVAVALEAGYRQIDCAAAYGNEKSVGRGISEGLRRATITRQAIWVTSKLWNDQ
jgi:alcohol dehydrogenase (NADP+)